MRPYRATKFRGLKVICFLGEPMSINNTPMFVDGEYVDGNLDVWDSYVDKYGSNRVRVYRTWNEAEDVAEKWNDEYEEEYNRIEKIKKEKEEEHWRIVEELKRKRKERLKKIYLKIRNFFK